MKRLYLFIILLLINISFYGQVLTITEVVKGETYTINGTTSGNQLIATEVDASTVRMFDVTLKSSNDYISLTSFTDFFVNGTNPTDVANAVELINATTNVSTPPPYYLNVTKGNVQNQFIVNKFGRNSVVGATLVPVCIGGNYRTPTTAEALEAVSTDTDDDFAGIGARQLFIQGLDSNFEMQEEIIEMDGTTPVALANTYTRVFRSYVYSSGTYANQTSGSHQGNIVIRGTGGGDEWLRISVEDLFGIGQSQVGVYTVPRGYTAYLLSKIATVESNKPASIHFFKRENIDTILAPFSPMRLFEENNGIEVPLIVATGVPLQTFPEMTDVGFMAKVDVATASVSVDFQLLLIKNN